MIDQDLNTYLNQSGLKLERINSPIFSILSILVYHNSVSQQAYSKSRAKVNSRKWINYFNNGCYTVQLN